MLNIEEIRRQFPLLTGDSPVIYFDSGATSLKPQPVIDRVCRYMSRYPVSVHRGMHHLSEEAGRLFEEARTVTAGFIGAESPEQVIFTGNATMSINLTARSLKRLVSPTRRRILIFSSEHHSNIIPWMNLREEGFLPEIIPVDPMGRISIQNLGNHLNDRTALVAMAGVTNVLGIINPWEEACGMAHDAGALFLLDWAQGAGRIPLNVSLKGPDFVAFSAHKMFGPTGVGVLYGKPGLIEKMQALAPGGGTVEDVTPEGYTISPIPRHLEGGTPPIAGVIGLGAAVEWIESAGLENIARHEEELLEYGVKRLSSIPGVTLYGPDETRHRTGIIALNLEGWHCLEVCSMLDRSGRICLRGGMLCASLQVRALCPDGVIRISFGPYNTAGEIDRLGEILEEMTAL